MAVSTAAGAVRVGEPAAHVRLRVQWGWIGRSDGAEGVGGRGFHGRAAQA